MLKKADVEFKILKVPDEVLEEVVAQGIHSDPKSIIPFGNLSYFRLFLRLFLKFSDLEPENNFFKNESEVLLTSTVKSLTTESIPLATQSFKRSYKISHPP